MSAKFSLLSRKEANMSAMNYEFMIQIQNMLHARFEIFIYNWRKIIVMMFGIQYLDQFWEMLMEIGTSPQKCYKKFKNRMATSQIDQEA